MKVKNKNLLIVGLICLNISGVSAKSINNSI